MSGTTVNQRVRWLRKELKLTQCEFASVISVSSGHIACIETERRIVNNRTIKLICDTFNINGEWLRTGKGNVYNEDSSKIDTKLLALCETLKPKYQDFIYRTIDYFIKMQAEE